MAGRRHTPEQFLTWLRDAELMRSQGLSMTESARKLEVSGQTFHRWRNQFGGMKGEEMKRLRGLERENGCLKRVVADHALDIRMLKDTAEGKF